MKYYTQHLGRLVLSVLVLSFVACGKSAQQAQSGQEQASQALTSAKSTTETSFDADSAYRFVSEQVAFGPRVPGSQAHRQCGDWIADRLRSWGYVVIEQAFSGKDYFGQPIQGRNLIATRQAETTPRVLLMAHWDTRAIADHDPEHSKRMQPILGADDGGSGVGVLLELARQHAQKPIEGVELDFVFFDLEDGGSTGDNDSWCLGSQHWSKHPHQTGYKADLGILLDMVGAKDARFHWEGYSRAYAAPVLYKLWETARQIGWGQYFVSSDGGEMIDDHIPVIKNLGIPSVDIINYSPSNRHGFGDHWHTHGDNLNIIDRKTLRAVGETVQAMLHKHYHKH